MAKFKFKLASVEKVRLQSEEKKLEELSLCQRNYRSKIEDKRALLEKKKQVFSEKKELISRDASINEIRLIEDYILGIDQKIIQADQAIVRSRRFLEQAMRHYVMARRERMMIDQLKEKAQAEYKVEQSKLEQKNLDDLMTMRERLNHGPLDEEDIA